jgi:hypothetical protein
LRERLLAAYEKRADKLRGGRDRSGKLTRSALSAIIEAKLFRTNEEDCIDFADLSVEMQLELLDRLADDPALADHLIDRNPLVGHTFRLLTDCAPDLIEKNRAAVRSKYSLEAMALRLENLFELGDSLYKRECTCVPLTSANHEALIERYHTPEYMRLLF